MLDPHHDILDSWDQDCLARVRIHGKASEDALRIWRRLHPHHRPQNQA
ncbi:hypothetical protein P8605_28050 [Streptomyces sp. T-3]|nr:hypothetical protein [Streptomyces sp. T-3]